MMTGGMEETGSSAQGDKGAAQKQRREPRGLEEGLRGMGSRVGSRQNWQRSGWELEWHQQCFCYLQGTSKWRRRPRMWQRDSTQGTRGENRDLQTIGLVREENGGGREAQEETVEGRMVETGVGGSDQEAGCGEQRGRQNGTENQSLKAQLRGREGKGEIRIMSSGSRRARQRAGVHSRV